MCQSINNDIKLQRNVIPEKTLNMKYFVYLIATRINNKIISYAGYTNNLNKRLSLHNNSKGAKFTRGKKWKIVYSK